MIDKLKWDSDFFGYSVGKALVKDGEFFNEDLFVEKASSFKLVYLISETPLHLKGQSFRHVTNKVIFSQSLILNETNLGKNDCVYFKESQLDYYELLTLAYESGKHSRFKMDQGFRSDEFKRLYKEWLDKSLREEENTKVMVYKADSSLAGFITIILEEKTSEIGLLAVSPGFQGQGIGSKLLSCAENIARESFCSTIRVATQGINENAIKLYKKNGYQAVENFHIFHYWND